MSANMGRKTNTDSYNNFQRVIQNSVGMHVTNTCKYCGKTKSSGAHKRVADKCSRELQQKYREDIERKIMAAFGLAA